MCLASLQLGAACRRQAQELPFSHPEHSGKLEALEGQHCFCGDWEARVVAPVSARSAKSMLSDPAGVGAA